LFIVDGKTFLPTVPATEDEIEKVLIENKDTIFPDFMFIDIKMQGRTQTERTLNDLLLVSKTCEQWFIVEVERKSDEYYAQNHIHSQLSRQTRASWDRIVPEVQRKLIRDYDFTADGVLSLGDNDPGFLLIIPESTNTIKQICKEFDVTIVEVDLWINQRDGGKALSIKQIIGQKPEIWGADLINIERRHWEVVFDDIHFTFPHRWTKKIKQSKTSLIYIDDTAYPIQFNHKERVVIPVTQRKDSDTYRLAVLRELKATFTIREEEDSIYFDFEQRYIFS